MNSTQSPGLNHEAPSPFRFEKTPRACRIVGTMGPASSSPGIVEDMLLAGMNIARLNFSHGNYTSHEAIARTVRETALEMQKPVALLQDLQGHKIRVGKVQGEEPLCLYEGQEIYLGYGETVCAERIGIDYPQVTQYVYPGHLVFLDDGSIELETLSSKDNDLYCRVNLGGRLGSRKGAIFPDSDLSFPLLNEKDKADTHFGIALGVDMVAMSFVRSATEILEMRRHLATGGNKHSFIVAKIEDRKGIDNLDEILHAADAVLIARGDLGVTLPREKVPGIQKAIIEQANAAGTPAITATQMLESMTFHDKPTRAEVNDVYSAAIDGSDAVMLSGETATGRYPVRAVREMDRICREAEKAPRDRPEAIPVQGKRDMHAKMAASAVNLARNTEACCIVAFSLSGETLRALAAARSNVPVYGVVVEERLLRQLLLHWGLSLTTTRYQKKLEDLIDPTLQKLRADGIVAANERVVVMAGEAEANARETHSLKLYILE